MTHHLIYITANEKPTLFLDQQILKQLAETDSGVSSIQLIIGISEVFPVTDKQKKDWDTMVSTSLNSSTIVCTDIIYKSNVGRDFSSVQSCLEAIKAQPDDTVLVINRSTTGPLQPNWYKQFIDQFNRFDGVGLCGSTINFTNEDGVVVSPPTTHIQTYCFFSTYSLLKEMFDDFSGLMVTTRMDAIVKGELALSKKVFDMGKGLTCLAWKEFVFTKENPIDYNLPQTNISSDINTVPFRHRNHKEAQIPVLNRLKHFLVKQFA